MLKVLSLNSSAKEIVSFFQEKGINMSEMLWDNVFIFLSKICYYEEEEKRIFPSLVLGHNLEAEDFGKLFQIEVIPIVKEGDINLFFKRLKPLLPFCNNGWKVYVDIKEDMLGFGIMRNFSGIEGFTVDEVLVECQKENYEMIRSQYKISYAVIEPISINEFETVAMDGDALRVAFRLDKDNEKTCIGCKDQFVQDFLSSRTDERVEKAIKKIVKLFSQKLHGAICLVVDEECLLPNEQLKDGIFLEEPIDLAGLAAELLDKRVNLESKYMLTLSEKYYAMSGLFIEMLNFDGITIVNTQGKILAYNVFITPQNNISISSGGARKRAAQALLNNKESNYVGVYFQSQDGYFFYERIE